MPGCPSASWPTVSKWFVYKMLCVLVVVYFSFYIFAYWTLINKQKGPRAPTGWLILDNNPLLPSFHSGFSFSILVFKLVQLKWSVRSIYEPAMTDRFPGNHLNWKSKFRSIPFQESQVTLLIDFIILEVRGSWFIIQSKTKQPRSVYSELLLFLTAALQPCLGFLLLIAWPKPKLYYPIKNVLLLIT